MSFEITGKLLAKYDTIQRTDTFKTREFVIEKTEDINGRIITNYIKMQCVQDKTMLPDKFNIGDEVKVSFNIKGSKWSRDGKDNYITNLDAWRMELLKLNQGEEQQRPAANNFTAASQAEVADDLPF